MLMFKKILSSLTVLIFVFSMNAGAQSFKAERLSACDIMPRYAAGNIITSRINLQDGEFWTGYWNGAMDDKLSMVGVQTVPESYDAAICYPAGSANLSGMTIKGVRFSFPGCENITDLKVWMSTVLPKSPADADITVQEVKELTDAQNEYDPFIEVRFDKSYKCDMSKDLYIGYSFRVVAGESNAENFPILVYMDEDAPNALLLKFGGAENEWTDYNGFGFGKLALQVLMVGTFPDDGATINSSLGSLTGVVNSSMKVPVSVENAGKNGINDMDLEVSIGGNKTIVNVKPEQPVTGLGTKYDFDLSVTVPGEAESYDLTVKINKVNGVAVNYGAVASGKLYAVSRLVERIPVVEEFTAMWCGWCPRGMIAMSKLRADYGDKISLIAVHMDDDIAIKPDYNDLLKDLTGLPAAHIDRYHMGVDPYYGKSDAYGIKKLVEECMDRMPRAQILGSASIDGDILTARSETEFLYTGNGSDFGIAYVLTENGMEDSSWRQANNFSGNDGYIDQDDLFESWVYDDKFVKDVVYDDVAIAAQGVSKGVEGSVPAEVENGVKLTHSVEFDLSKYAVIQDRDNLGLVVMIIDNHTGGIINSHFVSIGSDTGIDVVGEDGAEASETARYTVDGRITKTPVKGLNIVKYSDGTVRKVMVR